MGAGHFPFSRCRARKLGLEIKLFKNRRGEIVPACLAGVDHVKNAVGVGVEQVQRRLGEIVRERRRADLIIDDFEWLASAGGVDHRLRKARPAKAVKPGGAEDEIVQMLESLNRLLAVQFCSAVFG